MKKNLCYYSRGTGTPCNFTCTGNRAGVSGTNYKTCFSGRNKYQSKGVKSVGEANYLPTGSFLAERSYVDGLGRPLQDINRGSGTL